MEAIHPTRAAACIGAAALLGLGAMWSDCQGGHLDLDGHVAAACVTDEDARVIAAVQQRFAGALGDAATSIHVSAAAGVVTLTGQVVDESQIGRASKLAYSVDGVERVENEIVVVRPPQNPRELATSDVRR